MLMLMTIVPLLLPCSLDPDQSCQKLQKYSLTTKGTAADRSALDLFHREALSGSFESSSAFIQGIKWRTMNDSIENA